MEHRCGTRVPIFATVRLVLPTRTLSACLENVSLSGAFVAVAERIPEQTRLVVELAKQESGMTPPWRIPAHVVRETKAGIGIEWSAFAPWAVTRLLRQNSLQTDPYRRAGESRWGAHHQSVAPPVEYY